MGIGSLTYPDYTGVENLTGAVNNVSVGRKHRSAPFHLTAIRRRRVCHVLLRGLALFVFEDRIDKTQYSAQDELPFGTAAIHISGAPTASSKRARSYEEDSGLK